MPNEDYAIRARVVGGEHLGDDGGDFPALLSKRAGLGPFFVVGHVHRVEIASGDQGSWRLVRVIHGFTVDVVGW